MIPELLKSKVPNITTLPGLAAEIPGFKYGNVKMSGLKKAKKVVHGTYDDFLKFIGCTVEGDIIEDEDEEEEQEDDEGVVRKRHDFDIFKIIKVYVF